MQSPLVIVDSFVGLKLSTITKKSTITREIHAKIDNRSSEHIQYNERFHYYDIHYYQRRLYYCFIPNSACARNLKDFALFGVRERNKETMSNFLFVPNTWEFRLALETFFAKDLHLLDGKINADTSMKMIPYFQPSLEATLYSISKDWVLKKLI